ncbi:sugar ABC transporter permease [Paenibacillus macquariensis subsp. defensor]|uniref:Carbohydrate ABC transporter membrane protein 2, CUT1 family n=1 Tax=Paenibacillus macquariensis TaxID=948756 RepID=A0ABY1K3I4_9BACL|nr:carbohydrate ABC transporter permease [Paenibacillus macquariensis]MEC0090390.1 carbohydrate ABC transporter permease [Paenibacillus macquariensis]OAB33142.1 sugar ABC transporter permease [Paenibacillus macquariensis subsp. defensor]OAB39739.1 sugar ABC transporter permease [Paenibacillus macquariensis subsp. macquariensis]SIR20425.1 carbohydrate ABC transporter membrane protein 2, CUT1 family [Paenibacillus macquariensis]
MTTLRKSIPHLFLLAYVFIILYPMFFLLNTSFKKNMQIDSDPWGLPQPFTLSNYTYSFSNSKIGIYFFNSFFISTVSTLLTILLAICIAYAITRMKYPSLSKYVYAILLLSLLIPAPSLLIPLYRMVNWLHIYNTPLALIIPYTTFGIPLTVFIIAAFLKSLPRELEEAGVIDGLSVYGLLGRIVLPLTMPTLVTVFILNYLGNWNEYVLANLFLSNDNLRTLPVAVVSFFNKYNTNYGALCASVMISIAPIILIYSILQKRIIEGVMAGSVKG